jgi:hypothetical protein
MPAKLVVTTKAEQMEEYPVKASKIFIFHIEDNRANLRFRKFHD